MSSLFYSFAAIVEPDCILLAVSCGGVEIGGDFNGGEYGEYGETDMLISVISLLTLWILVIVMASSLKTKLIMKRTKVTIAMLTLIVSTL